MVEICVPHSSYFSDRTSAQRPRLRMSLCPVCTQLYQRTGMIPFQRDLCLPFWGSRIVRSGSKIVSLRHFLRIIFRMNCCPLILHLPYWFVIYTLYFHPFICLRNFCLLHNMRLENNFCRTDPFESIFKAFNPYRLYPDWGIAPFLLTSQFDLIPVINPSGSLGYHWANKPTNRMSETVTSDDKVTTQGESFMKSLKIILN